MNFFAHEHVDHSAGMDDVRPFFRQGDIVLKSRAIDTKNADYIFSNENKYPGAPSVTVK